MKLLVWKMHENYVLPPEIKIHCCLSGSCWLARHFLVQMLSRLVGIIYCSMLKGWISFDVLDFLLFFFPGGIDITFHKNKSGFSFCFIFLQDCHQPFAGGSFFDYEGLPYCETHYHAKRGSLCAGCQAPITGRCITAMFKKFHPEHFVCAFWFKAA